MAGWTRPPGPLNIWNVIEGYEQLADGSKKPIQFSIQEIPNEENRRTEALNVLTDIFLRDEPITSSLNYRNNPMSLECFQRMWKYQLDQGVVIGCYSLDTEGKIEKLVGMNATYISTNETDNDLMNIAQDYAEKDPHLVIVFAFMGGLMKKSDARKKYNVDKYISALGLVVLPEFRGQKLGLHILNARSAVAKKYGIGATSTLFTAISSQIQAKHAGYEETYSVDYADAVDETGNPIFPSNMKAKCVKVMMRSFP